jgi:hypothetical protein
MKVYGEVDVSIHVFLILALVGSGQHHDMAALPTGKKAPGIHCVGVWVGPRDSPDDVWNPLVIQPVASQLYLLCSPSSMKDRRGQRK